MEPCSSSRLIATSAICTLKLLMLAAVYYVSGARFSEEGVFQEYVMFCQMETQVVSTQEECLVADVRKCERRSFGQYAKLST